MKMTHTGIVEGNDNRTPDNYKRKVPLRETKLYWINQYHEKFSKERDGRSTGDWPMYRLIIDYIKKIGAEK